jgi:hypothetical protein
MIIGMFFEERRDVLEIILFYHEIWVRVDWLFELRGDILFWFVLEIF